MRIGLDFDNTIVSYDKLFHTVAREEGLIPSDFPVSKLAIRDYLRQIDQEDLWTEMQGTVYGSRMLEAQAYPGVLEFIRRARTSGHTLAIVSHKTQYNFRGPRYDLHAAARSWIEHYFCEESSFLIPEDHIFFELTKDEKWARISQFACDVFIDDLPEILLAAAFPAKTRPFLFDPHGDHMNAELPGVERISSWQGFEKCLGL